MATSHFDVVVLGRGLGSLAAGALLARNGFRVLVVGHGDRESMYRFDGHALARRAFVFTTSASPVLENILAGLAQSQAVRRLLRREVPMFQWIGADRVLEVPPDRAAFGRELARHFGKASPSIEKFYDTLSEATLTIDAGLAQEYICPPRGFWEKQKVDQALGRLPWQNARIEGELPRLVGAYASVIEASAQFASDAFPCRSAFATMRLHSAWTRGLYTFPRGEEELASFFFERILAHGGEVRAHDRATRLVLKGGKLVALSTGDERKTVGFDHLITGLPPSQLAPLTQGEGSRGVAGDEAFRASAVRFIVTFVVGDACVSDELASESFIATSDTELGTIHLQRRPGTILGTTMLVAEVLLTRGVIPELRERVASSLARVLPFLREHLVLVDSPHDGRPLFDYRGGAKESIERITLRGHGGSALAEIPTPLYYISGSDRMWGLGLAELATSYENAWYCGPAVLPALGQEGMWMAGLSVSRLLRKADGSKERLRRSLWGKVDLK